MPLAILENIWINFILRIIRCYNFTHTSAFCVIISADWLRTINWKYNNAIQWMLNRRLRKKTSFFDFYVSATPLIFNVRWENTVKIKAKCRKVLCNGIGVVAFAFLILFLLSPIFLMAEEILPDSDFFCFGKVLKVDGLENPHKKNPHHIAQYSIFLCKQGFTEKMIEEIGHVEKNETLGKSLIAFLREFGPDLEVFKNKTIFLKFYGYRVGKDTSIWYYYFTDAMGKELPRKPWISVHRSNYDFQCALTGIFLNLPGEEISTIPKGLKTINSKYNIEQDNSVDVE